MSDSEAPVELQQRVNEFRRRVADTAPDALDCGKLGELAQSIANQLGRELMRDVFERADAQSPTVTIDGEQWGNQRRKKGTYETMFGEVELERSTYQRAGRGRVAVPLELRLGIIERRYTPRVARTIAYSTP